MSAGMAWASSRFLLLVGGFSRGFPTTKGSRLTVSFAKLSAKLFDDALFLSQLFGLAGEFSLQALILSLKGFELSEKLSASG